MDTDSIEDNEMRTHLSVTEIIRELPKRIEKVAKKMTCLEAQIAKSNKATPEAPEKNILDIIEDYRKGQEASAPATGIQERPDPPRPQAKGIPTTRGPAKTKEAMTAGPAKGPKKKSWNEVASAKDKEWQPEFLAGTRAIDRKRARKETPSTPSLKPKMGPNSDPRN
jgi:hypothetical protein